MGINPKVSVICVTYNHELYIREALDSILAQKTNFDFEVLVGEDCSKDGTRDILKEYEQKYPGIFRMYYRDENLGATRNEYDLLMDAKGDYIAALELDDLWTDISKLQKQYDFLEAHDEFIGVSHDFEIIDKSGNVIDNDDNKAIKEFLGKKFDLKDFLEYGFVFQTGTHFYRNIFKDGKDYSIIYKADRLIRDKTILSLLLDRGDFFILEDNMSAYRRFMDGDKISGRNATNANMELDLYTKAHHVQMLNEYFEGRIDYSRQWSNIIWDYGKRALGRKESYSIKRFREMYRKSDKKTRKMVRNELMASLTRRTKLARAIKVILFLFIFLFLFRSVSYTMRSNGDAKQRFTGFYAEDKNTIDVFMMGSSTVASSFCPAYMWGNYGFTSYPLSSNSQRPKAIKYLIEEGLKYQNPKLIVIEMRTFIADDSELATDEGHIREVVDNMRYSVQRIRTVNALTDQLDNRYSYYVDLIKYHSNYGTLLDPTQLVLFNFSSNNIDKGFVYKTHTENFRLETPELYTEDRLPIPEEQGEVLKDLLNYLKSNNLEALFVVAPRDNLDGYQEMMNYCQDMVEAEGYRFLNMNYLYDEMGFDYRYDIDDGAHTNVWGAVKVSKLLGSYIADNYQIKSKNSNSVNENWNEAYRHFNDEYAYLVPEDKSTR